MIAERKADHSEHEIRHDLPEKKFPGADGRDEQRLEGSTLPFTRHHQRGQERTDQRHHQHDESRDEEIGALVRFVEPQPVLDDDRRAESSRPRAASRAIHVPMAPWA